VNANINQRQLQRPKRALLGCYDEPDHRRVCLQQQHPETKHNDSTAQHDKGEFVKFGNLKKRKNTRARE